MKKNLIYLGIILCVVIFTIAFFVLLYINHVESNIEKKALVVGEDWNKFYGFRNDRIILLSDFIKITDNSNINSDSLMLFLNEAKLVKNNDCSLDFVFSEYKINKEYLSLLKGLNLNIIDSSIIIKKIAFNTEELNEVRGLYNMNVRDYNKYITILPNNFIAKKNGYYQRGYFNITYGLDNEDPIKKRKEAFKMLRDSF